MSSDRQAEFAVDPYRALMPVGDQVSSFLYVLDSYEQRHWQIPTHQRKPDAWDASKQKRYVERLRGSRLGNHPPGVFATYQIPASPVFLNDGLQRITTLKVLRHDPALFGMDEEGVRELLNQTVTIQHRHYDSHESAMADFQLINFGTRLTPFELCNGYLTYMEHYDTTWGVVIQDVENAIEASWQRLGTGVKVKRETHHKMKRQVLALIIRYIDEVKEPKAYVDVGRKDIDPDRIHQTVELTLRNRLPGMGFDEFSEKGKRLCRLITSYTALLEDVRNEVLSPGVGFVPVLHRWVLDFAVWAQNNRVTKVKQVEFLKVLLSETRGKNQWVGSEKEVMTLSFAHLGVLPKLATWAGMADMVSQPRRKRPREQSRPGYQDSHIRPFSINGEGPTVKEPGLLNMARGAEPMDDAR